VAAHITVFEAGHPCRLSEEAVGLYLYTLATVAQAVIEEGGEWPHDVQLFQQILN
jgi:hypothetical protein